MVLQSLRRPLGVGGPALDTVLAGLDVQPGGSVSDQVHVAVGAHGVEVERIVAAQAAAVDWTAGVDRWVRQATERRGWHF